MNLAQINLQEKERNLKKFLNEFAEVIDHHIFLPMGIKNSLVTEILKKVNVSLYKRVRDINVNLDVTLNLEDVDLKIRSQIPTIRENKQFCRRKRADG